MSAKTIILILGTKDKNYEGFVKACNSTWISDVKKSSIPYYFYQGGSEKEYLDGDTIHLNIDDSLSGTGLKLFAALRFIEDRKFEYDYIFRTNLSSYLYVDQLLNFIAENQNIDLYAGYKGKFNPFSSFKSELLNKIILRLSNKNPVEFASGSGFLISRNNVKRILADSSLRFDWIDDVMVGECLSRNGIKIVSSSRIDLNDEKVTFSNKFDDLSSIRNCYHIRLKSKDRTLDVARFYLLAQSDYFKLEEFEKLRIRKIIK